MSFDAIQSELHILYILMIFIRKLRKSLFYRFIFFVVGIDLLFYYSIRPKKS